MRTWAISNQKGGVGKTTTAVSLAGLLSNRGESVLLVDLDPHGSMTAHFGYDPDEITPSVYDLFHDSVDPSDIPMLLRSTGVKNISLLPASTALATLDRQLGSRHGKGLVVRKAVRAMSSRFDTVCIDCPPMLGVLMVNALAACDELLVPVQTEFLAIKGLERMLHTLEMIQRSRRAALPYRVVPTMFDRRTRESVEALRELRERYGDAVWSGAIPVDTRFRDASRQGVPLTVSYPWSRGSQSYRKLLEALLEDETPAAEAVGHD